MKRFIVIILFLFAFIAPAMAGTPLDEANAKFTYKNKPIHPFLLGEFLGWLSDDRPPMVTTVDVAAAFDTNKYPSGEVKWQYGQWMVDREEGEGDLKTYESYGYNWLGKMANNVHVVEIGESGGGSGYFMDLIFVKFSESEIVWQDKKEKQLLMSIVGTYRLGDRYEGEIKVYPDKVFIPASKNQHGGGSVEKDIELKFQTNGTK